MPAWLGNCRSSWTWNNLWKMPNKSTKSNQRRIPRKCCFIFNTLFLTERVVLRFIFASILRRPSQSNARRTAEEIVSAYFHSPPLVETTNPLQWWHIQKPNFGLLYKVKIFIIQFNLFKLQFLLFYRSLEKFSAFLPRLQPLNACSRLLTTQLLTIETA